MADAPPPEQTAIPIGPGDDLDLAAGRCCPTCRHDLTRHNVEVWNAGYSVAQRHAQDDIRRAWDAGYNASIEQYMKAAEDPKYHMRRNNPHGVGF